MTAPPAALAVLLAGYEAECVQEGEGGCAVHRHQAPGRPTLYLKHGTGTAARDLVAETARLRWLAERALAPTIVWAGAAGDAAWLLIQAAPGRSAGDWLAGDIGRLPKVVAGLVEALRALHALPVADCPFDAGLTLRLGEARRNVDEGRVDQEDFDDDHQGWSATRVLAEVERLASAVPTGDMVVSHGDFTLGNLMLDGDGRFTGFIDAGRLGRADPYQDIALCWRDLGGFGEAAQDAFIDALAIGAPDAARLLLYRSLDELF